MTKKNLFGFLTVLSLFIFASGCGLISKDDSGSNEDFKRGSSGLEMKFIPNYPGDKYLVTDSPEKISIVVDVKNTGTYPDSTQNGGKFSEGKIYLSGFDDRIVDMSGLTEAQKTAAEKDKTLKNIRIAAKSKALSGKFLPGASSLNPQGSLDSVDFDGEINNENIDVDTYNPTMLITACYPYVTKTSPTVCIDPNPFDDTEEKVCNIGSQTLAPQGAPVAVTKIEQEASTNKIQFKIHIKNVGGGGCLKIWSVCG